MTRFSRKRSTAIELLERRRLFASALTLTGSTGNNFFLLRRNIDGVHVDVWTNSSTPGVGTPTQSNLSSSITTVTVAPTGVNNSITIDFSNGDPFPSTVNLTGGSGITNTLTVDTASGTAVLVGATTVTFGSTAINYANLQSIVINGTSASDTLTQTAQPAAPVVFNGGAGSDTLNVNAGTFTFATDPAAATSNLAVNVAGSVWFGQGAGVHALHLATLNISAGGSATVDTPPSAADRAVLVVGRLTVAPTGLLDLTGNDLVARNLSTSTAIGLLQQGYANGAWNGTTGITTSLAAIDPTRTSALAVSPGGASFDGESTSSADTLFKFTTYGDANLDGKVDGSDYTKIDNGYLTHATGWTAGDFNYSAVVDASDYTLADNAFNRQAGGIDSSLYTLHYAQDVAREQVLKTIAAIGSTSNYPQYATAQGPWSWVPTSHWTTGYWPALLMDLYGSTGNPYYKTMATQYALPLTANSNATSDVGPEVFLPLYPVLQADPTNTTVKNAMLAAAASKATQYNATVGAFKAWRPSTSGNPAANFNVLMDLIMDSDLMFWASQQSGNQTYANEAIQNAVTEETYLVHMNQSGWANGSTSQFGYFNSSNGSFVDNETYQGYSNTSVWSRGQAWAILGFDRMYQQTGRSDFLSTSENAANFFISNLPADDVPWWDFSRPDTYRDTSAAAIAATGLLQLSKSIATTDPGNSARYRAAAKSILLSLSSTSYLNNPAGVGDGILLHGALNVPASPSNYDNSLIFGDHYFMEAVNECLAG